MHSKESVQNGNEPSSTNPQKKRLEQLKKRMESAELIAKQLTPTTPTLGHNSKSKKKAALEQMKAREKKMEVKLSTEIVDYEYSVDEESEDEEYNNTKNEAIKKLITDKNRLEKVLKLARENEKKVKSMLDASGSWFDRYDLMLEELDEQLAVYDSKRKAVVDNIILNIQPICERWQKARNEMTAVNSSVKVGTMSSMSVFGNLLHYGITVLRQLLFYMAYCRDLVSKSEARAATIENTPSMSESPKTE